MKKYLMVFLLAAGISVTASAQKPATASDFTVSDCDGTEHQLFSYLDKGDVVAIEFVMGCLPCVSGRKALAKIEAEYAATHPGKFHLLTFGYSSSLDCSSMQSWMINNKFNGAYLGGDDAIISNYGASGGMPTICIVGGKDHKVLYWKKGFANSDTTAMKTAISKGLTQASVAALSDNETFNFFPNPAKGMLNVQLAEVKPNSLIKIYDESGKEVMTFAVVSANPQINISVLSSGAYHLTLLADGIAVATKAFTVQK